LVLRSSTAFSSNRFPYRVAILALAGMALLRNIWLLAMGRNFVVSNLTIDDTYYYLGTAWNLHDFGFPTFDGVNSTNGVQFLWFWILAALRPFCSSREVFLFAALGLCAVLGSTAILLAARFGRLLAGRAAGFVAAVLIFKLIAFRRFGLLGLENVLHLVVFLTACIVTMLVWSNFPGRREWSRTRGPVLAIFLWTLNTWCRLDGAVFTVPASAALAALLIFRARQTGRPFPLRILALGLLVAIVGAIIQLGGNRLMGGSWVPVSGLWKLGSASEKIPLDVLVPLWGRTLPAILQLGWAMPKGADDLVCTLILGALLTGGLWQGVHFPKDRRSIAIAALAGTCLLHQFVLITRMGDYVLRANWYQTPCYATAALMIAVALAATLRGLPRLPWIQPAFGGAFLVFMLMAVAERDRRMIGSADRTERLFETRLVAAAWIDANLPPNARVAAFNTGQLGYFSGRSTTNLDGLINSYAYFIFRKSGGTTLAYLRSEKISYYADYTVAPELSRESDLVKSFRIDGMRPFEIRRVRPEGSEALPTNAHAN